MKKKNEISIVRSSAAEYLTFLTATGQSDVNAIYADENILNAMSRIVSAYLDLAEAKAEDEIPMTMEDWAKQFEGILRLSQKEILTNAGTISAEIAKQHAESEFEKYRVKQDHLFESDFDKFMLGMDTLKGGDTI